MERKYRIVVSPGGHETVVFAYSWKDAVRKWKEATGIQTLEEGQTLTEVTPRRFLLEGRPVDEQTAFTALAPTTPDTGCRHTRFLPGNESTLKLGCCSSLLRCSVCGKNFYSHELP